MILWLNTTPVYLCIFNDIQPKNKNKERLFAYKCILKIHLVSPTMVHVDKVLYNPYEYDPESYYYCNPFIDSYKGDICGQLEKAGLVDEEYLCMETVDHLFREPGGL